MSISASTAGRDAAGRFLPGRSGNPGGKAPGTRNRATRLRELVADGEERVIGRVLIDKAKAGDAVAARFVISHLMPVPRGRAVALDFPEGTWPGDVVAMFNATMLAMASGEITPDEALTITRTFDGRLKALKAYETERYMTRWEAIPGDTAFEEPAEEGEEEDVPVAPTEPAPANHLHRGERPHPDPLPRGEGKEARKEVRLAEPSDAPAAAPTEPSPLGRGQGEGGAVPANALHRGGHPHPDPLPGGEGAEYLEPSPLGRGQGEGVSPASDLHPGEHPHPIPPEPLSKGPGGEGASLHPTCIQPSPATLAGRRRVAEEVLRQWSRTLPG